jgi:predicted nucleic acid-binding protein
MIGMKALLDTSTLTAAMLPDHIHHAHALPWLSQAKNGAFEFVCSAHSLAEIYAVLTRLRRTPPISPDEALRLIQENVTPHARVVSLSSDEYASMIESLAHNGIAGAAVYDAIIAQVGELTAVDYLVTLNVTDFQRVWPAGATKIVSPQTLSPP